ncbi:MAG: tetratricopeptide repeat protein [Acidiferrobacteraceae bacterium]
MIVIVILACFVTAATVWILARPSAPGDAVARARRLEIESLRGRLLAQLRELDSDRVDRRVDDTIGGEEVQRLEFDLAQVLKEQAALEQTDALAAPARRGRRSPLRVGVLTVVLVGIAGTLYVVQSREWLHSIINPEKAQTAVAAGQAQIPSAVFQMVAELRSHLKRHPDDVRGWMTLGHSYLVLGQHAQAEAAYRRAYRLSPRDPKVIASYAWLLYSAHPTRTTGLVAVLYHRLYRIDPNRQDALWFLGLEAYNKGQLHHALGFWQRLLALIPKSGQAAKGVREAIANVREALKEQAPGVRTPG